MGLSEGRGRSSEEVEASSDNLHKYTPPMNTLSLYVLYRLKYIIIYCIIIRNLNAKLKNMHIHVYCMC